MSAFTDKPSEAPDSSLLKKMIGPDIARIEAAIRSDLESVADQMDDLLLEVLRYGILSGGKRFRPLLVVLAFRLCGGTDPAVYPLAMAFEYLHAATLFHDDVIDNAETRRGRPTINKKFGTVAAILAGDFLHARSMAIIGERGGIEALQIFCRATGGMVDGEFLQLRNAANFNQSEDDYFAAITGKTVLLIEAATEIGALFAKGTEKYRQVLRRYGNSLGCAFQIVDDLLDYLGDGNVTGKAVGNDLAEGKMTLPLILALKRADGGDREKIEEILHDPRMRRNRFTEIRDMIEKYNGFGDTRRMAEEIIGQAIGQLGIFTGEEQSRDRNILEGLAGYVLTRKK